MVNIGKLLGEKDIIRNRSLLFFSKRVSSFCFGCGEVGYFKMKCLKWVNVFFERKVIFVE